MLTYPQIKSFDNKTESIFQSAETDRIINLIWLIRVYIGFHLDDLNLQPLRGSPARMANNIRCESSTVNSHRELWKRALTTT